MLWYALCLGELSLDVVRRDWPTTSEPAPLAIADRLQIVAADARARRLGIVFGLGQAAALALSPALRLYERDVPGERQALEELALRMLRFTPSVSLETRLPAPGLGAGSPKRPAAPSHGLSLEPSGLLLEVQPSLRYFGGHCALLHRIREELAEAGIGASIGWAPNPGAAWLLARRHDGNGCLDPGELPARLGELPVALLESARERLELFDGAGLRCLGELLRLPRSGLAQRFGPSLLDELDRALGRRPDPRRWYEAPARFSMRLELPASVSTTEALSFAARRLIAKLAVWLETLQKGARSFELAIEHGDHPDSLLKPGLAEPAWQPERLFGLLREQLATMRLPAPARALRLSCADLADAAPSSGTLFADPASAPAMLGPLLERLQARLGREKVRILRARPEHRPELAWGSAEPELALLNRPDSRRTGARTRRPTSSSSGGRASSPGSPSRRADSSGGRHDEPMQPALLPRPLWLLDTPEPLVERDGRPCWQGPLTLLAGPERIESGWWDEQPVQRDYFVAEDDAHRLLWIYRERPSASRPTRGAGSGWFLHGHFG